MQVCSIRNVNQVTVQHAKLLHGHVVQFPPTRAEDVFNDITSTVDSNVKCS